jgi:hypothetical protein
MKIHHLPLEVVNTAIDHNIPRFIIDYELVGTKQARTNSLGFQQWIDLKGGSISPRIDLDDVTQQNRIFALMIESNEPKLKKPGDSNVSNVSKEELMKNVAVNLRDWALHAYSPHDFSKYCCTITYDFLNKKIHCQKWKTIFTKPEQSNLPIWRRETGREMVGEIETFDMDYSSYDQFKEFMLSNQVGSGQENWI